MKNITKAQKSVENKIVDSQSAGIIRDLIVTALNLTKYGVPFAGLIDSFIQTRRLLRIERFAEDLSDDLGKIDRKIDVEYIRTDEFAFLFEQCFKSASENYQKEKLDAYRAILVNSLVETDVSQEQKEFYYNLINKLTTIHFKILKFCYDTYGFIEAKGISPNQIKGNIGNSFQAIFPEYDIGTIKMVINDLYSFGLINLFHTNFDSITAGQGMALIGDKRTLESGDAFYEFITLD